MKPHFSHPIMDLESWSVIDQERLKTVSLEIWLLDSELDKSKLEHPADQKEMLNTTKSSESKKN